MSTSMHGQMLIARVTSEKNVANGTLLCKNNTKEGGPWLPRVPSIVEAAG